MDLNVQTAKKLLNNPPPQLNNLLSQSTDEAKSAIAQARNGIASDASAKGGNGEAAGRLQIVDEEKKFSYVVLSLKVLAGMGIELTCVESGKT
jgi:hypothetical protein